MQYNVGKKGFIEVITGPMFAGKTEELIRRVKRMEYAHKNYVIFKPAIDNRYSESEIVSHNKKALHAINISHGSDIRRHLAESVTKLTAICSVCGESATRTQRIIDGKPAYYNDPTILVGANDSYEARCRSCHIVLFDNEK